MSNLQLTKAHRYKTLCENIIKLLETVLLNYSLQRGHYDYRNYMTRTHLAVQLTLVCGALSQQ